MITLCDGLRRRYAPRNDGAGENALLGMVCSVKPIKRWIATSLCSSQ
ncbi:MAG: hypothetical protein HON78_00170 [Legionellales bacterium]|nr:hypothetical protein [Legionellales bacterium]